MPSFTPAAKNKSSRPRERFRRALVGFNLLSFIRARQTCMFGFAEHAGLETRHLIGGGGYYAFNTYGGAGLGGVLGTVLVIFLILWLLGLVR